MYVASDRNRAPSVLCSTVQRLLAAAWQLTSGRCSGGRYVYISGIVVNAASITLHVHLAAWSLANMTSTLICSLSLSIKDIWPAHTRVVYTPCSIKSGPILFSFHNFSKCWTILTTVMSLCSLRIFLTRFLLTALQDLGHAKRPKSRTSTSYEIAFWTNGISLTSASWTSHCAISEGSTLLVD